MDTEKRRLLDMQYDSISQDIGMMASEWQLGKTALNHVFELSMPLPAQGSGSPSALSDLQGGGHGLGVDTLEQSAGHDGPVVDSMETLEDQQRLMALAAKREETWEASTESKPLSSRRLEFAADGSATAKMTRAERIAHQKLLREQEEVKKERVYDNSKMVHELKDVLGRRRHLRENDDDTEPASASPSIPVVASTLSTSSRKQDGQARVEAMDYSLVGAGSLAEQLAKAVAERDGQSNSESAQQQYLSLAEEFSGSTPSDRISPFSLSTLAFASGSDSYMSFIESSLETMDESIVEITGVGEADEEEEEQQQEAEEEELHDDESEHTPQI